MSYFLQTIRPGDIAILIAFSTALAAVGTYFVYWLRLRHDRSTLLIDRASLAGTRLNLRVVNAGSRSALDVLVELSDHPNFVGMECVRADEAILLAFDTVQLPLTATLAWRDPFLGRFVECRTVQMSADGLQFGPRQKGQIESSGRPLAIAP